MYASEVMPQTPDEAPDRGARRRPRLRGAPQLGWGPLGRDLAHDEALVRAARETLGPDRSLMLDGGRAYTVKQALEPPARRGVRAVLVQEALPPDDLDGYRRLSDAARARIAAGEADATLALFARSSSSAT